MLPIHSGVDMVLDGRIVTSFLAGSEAQAEKLGLELVDALCLPNKDNCKLNAEPPCK